MSLFIPFKPLHQNPVKFQGDKSGELSHSNSSDSLHSRSAKADSPSGRKSPTPERDHFKRSHSQGEITREELQVTSHALDEEGGSFNADHRQALLNDWLNTNEDDDLMELVRKNIEESPEKPADSSAPKKRNNRPTLNLTSERLGEEGGFSFTSFMLETPKSHDKSLLHTHLDEPNSLAASRKKTSINDLANLENAKPTKSKKRKLGDLLGS